MRLPDAVEVWLLGEIRYVDCYLQHARDARATRLQQFGELAQHVVGLAGHVEARVIRNDAAYIEHATVCHDLVTKTIPRQQTLDHVLSCANASTACLESSMEVYTPHGVGDACRYDRTLEH